jgi:hypothetical protein
LVAQLGRQRFELVHLTAGHGDRCTLRVERLGDGAADAAGGAGDECGLACEVEH